MSKSNSYTNTPDTDVAVILEQLRSEVRARHAAREGDDESRTISRTTERQLECCAEQLEMTRVISAHWPLEHRNLIERGINIMHRLVRRFLRWYINPIVEQQNGFNDVAARTLRLLIDGYRELAVQVAESGERGAGSGEREESRERFSPDTHPPPTAELQMLVQQHSQNEPPAVFPELALPRCTAQLAAQQQVHAHWPLAGHPGTIFTQKIIRQYLRWLINPIVEQQNMFNGTLTASMAPMIAADNDVRAVVAALRVRWKRQAMQQKREE